MALHLVTAAARRVELANLMAQSRRDWVLRFSQSPDFLDVDPDAAIALDAHGRINAMTHAGARLLAAAARLDWRQRHALIGQPLERFFSSTRATCPICAPTVRRSNASSAPATAGSCSPMRSSRCVC